VIGRAGVCTSPDIPRSRSESQLLAERAELDTPEDQQTIRSSLLAGQAPSGHSAANTAIRYNSIIAARHCRLVMTEPFMDYPSKYNDLPVCSFSLTSFDSFWHNCLYLTVHSVMSMLYFRLPVGSLGALSPPLDLSETLDTRVPKNDGC
jgi:hypothetical protein